jgi:hypothetical protein
MHSIVLIVLVFFCEAFTVVSVVNVVWVDEPSAGRAQ